MKNYTLLIVLIITSLQIFAQQKTTVVLKDSTIFNGKIMRYDNNEIKLLDKGKIYTIRKANILSPNNIKIKSSNVYTVIETEKGFLVYGKIIKETETVITIRTNFKSERINKTTILYQAFYVKNYYEETESFIKTSDGNLFIGDVLIKHKNSTLIDVGNGMKQEINNELIIERIDRRKSKKRSNRVLFSSVFIAFGIYFSLL